MATNFPSGIDTFSTKVDRGVVYHTDINNLQDAVVALETYYNVGNITYLESAAIGAAGDGTTDDTTALTNALAGGGVVVGTPGSTYKITAAIPMVSNTIFDLNGATILQAGVAGATGFLYAAGTQSAKVAFTGNQAAGANTISLPTGEGAAGAWAVDDLIMLESETVDINQTTDTFAKELHKVRGVSGDTLTIDGALIWAHTTANSAKYSKVTPKKNITIKNFNATNNSVSANYGYSIRFDYCENIKLKNVHLYNCGGGIPLYDVYGFNIDNITIEHVTDFAGARVAYGYGIFAASTACHGHISNFTAHDLRHAFTTIYEQRSTEFWGSPRHITLENCFGDAAGSSDSTAIWDTHQAGYDITFSNVVAQGGKTSVTAGFQLRCPVTLINCKALQCGARGINAADGSEGSQIIGGEFAYCETNGVTTRGGYLISDVHVHHNGSAGVVTVGDNVMVRDCYIHDNGSYGIQYSSGGNPIYEHNTIYFTTAVQTSGILNAPATAIVRDNIFGSGWTGGGALQGVDASAIVQRNTGFVTENSGTAAINSGATSVTVSHGCHRTPALDDISIVFGEQGTNNYGRWWIDTIDATTFRVNVSADPGASNLDFGWRVVIL